MNDKSVRSDSYAVKDKPVCPCDNCRKKNNCPAVCYVKLDWLRAMRKKGYKT